MLQAVAAKINPWTADKGRQPATFADVDRGAAVGREHDRASGALALYERWADAAPETDLARFYGEVVNTCARRRDLRHLLPATAIVDVGPTVADDVQPTGSDARKPSDHCGGKVIPRALASGWGL